MADDAVVTGAKSGPPLGEHPVVTFALFAYNQEQYVREAIEGAFAQTYKPLEIILSDDCPSDRNFEIMHEMAAAYRGSHKVIARRSSRNRQVLRQVLDVSQLAHGKTYGGFSRRRSFGPAAHRTS